MITKIENGIVTVEPYGFSAGRYPIEEFTAEDLVIERNKLHIKILYVQRVEPTEKDIAEIAALNRLIERLTELIDLKLCEKCRKE